MAEPSRCPYCGTGVPLWVLLEAENRYIIACTHCGAYGHYIDGVKNETFPARGWETVKITWYTRLWWRIQEIIDRLLGREVGDAR